jgi:hypothetical protein
MNFHRCVRVGRASGTADERPVQQARLRPLNEWTTDVNVVPGSPSVSSIGVDRRHGCLDRHPAGCTFTPVAPGRLCRADDAFRAVLRWSLIPSKSRRVPLRWKLAEHPMRFRRHVLKLLTAGAVEAPAWSLPIARACRAARSLQRERGQGVISCWWRRQEGLACQARCLPPFKMPRA